MVIGFLALLVVYTYELNRRIQFARNHTDQEPVQAGDGVSLDEEKATSGLVLGLAASPLVAVILWQVLEVVALTNSTPVDQSYQT